MAYHSPRSPSGAPRWMRCPGSVNFLRNIPNETSIFAAEGSAAHDVRDWCLRFGFEPYDFIGKQIKAEKWSFEFEESWAKALQPGIDRLREVDGRLYSERRVHLDRWLPGDSGTLDSGFFSKTLIGISDLKFGAGVPVSPVENEQLMIYALGFWDNIARHKTKAKKFLIIIDQPRCAGGGGEWETNLSDLLDFGREVYKAGERTKEPDAPLIAGEKQCFWCPGKDNGCPAYEKFNLDLMNMHFDDLDAYDALGVTPVPSSKGMTPKRKAFVVKHRAMFVKFLDRLHAEVLADAVAGKPTPGLKAIEGRKGSRYWRDELAAELFLVKHLGKRQAFNKALKTPTQVDGLFNEQLINKIKAMTAQNDPKPSLVSEETAGTLYKGILEHFENLEPDEFEND